MVFGVNPLFLGDLHLKIVIYSFTNKGTSTVHTSPSVTIVPKRLVYRTAIVNCFNSLVLEDYPFLGPPASNHLSYRETVRIIANITEKLLKLLIKTSKISNLKISF